MEGRVFLKNGESLLDKNGNILFTATKDLRVCDTVHHTDVIYPNGKHPDKRDEISSEILEAVLNKCREMSEEERE